MITPLHHLFCISFVSVHILLGFCVAFFSLTFYPALFSLYYWLGLGCSCPLYIPCLTAVWLAVRPVERLWLMGTHLEHYISTITILKGLSAGHREPACATPAHTSNWLVPLFDTSVMICWCMHCFGAVHMFPNIFMFWLFHTSSYPGMWCDNILHLLPNAEKKPDTISSL